jgi:hypothetical protein
VPLAVEVEDAVADTTDVDSDTTADTPGVLAVAVEEGVAPLVSELVGADVDDAGGRTGEHVDCGSALPRGGGSVGLPAPCGWNRHPSTVVARTREPAGPTLE